MEKVALDAGGMVAGGWVEIEKSAPVMDAELIWRGSSPLLWMVNVRLVEEPSITEPNSVLSSLMVEKSPFWISRLLPESDISGPDISRKIIDCAEAPLESVAVRVMMCRPGEREDVSRGEPVPI